MQTNEAALKLIKDFEGWRANAYPDPATGGAPWTIGYGHTTAAGPPKVAKGLKITQEEGDAILRRDLKAVEKTVADAVKVPLNENQFGALVSFTFNCGGGNLRKSTLLKKVNDKDFKAAAAEFAKWNKAAGKVMAGLTRRRAAETALFLLPSKVAATTDTPATTVTVKTEGEAPVTTTIPADTLPPAPAKPAQNRLWLAVFSILAGLAAGAVAFFTGGPNG